MSVFIYNQVSKTSKASNESDFHEDERKKDSPGIGTSFLRLNEDHMSTTRRALVSKILTALVLRENNAEPQ